MKYYMGVHLVQAKPMTLGEWLIDKSYEDYMGRSSETIGYIVERPNTYPLWISKEEFESIYLPLTRPDSIMEPDLESFVGSMSETFSVDQPDNKTTMVRMETRTGYVDYATSSCVDPANYNQDIGINNCLGELKNKLWPMLGFVLQWAKYGLKPVSENKPEEDTTSEPM